jgi:hypothetical protein
MIFNNIKSFFPECEGQLLSNSVEEKVSKKLKWLCPSEWELCTVHEDNVCIKIWKWIMGRILIHLVCSSKKIIPCI